MINLELIEDIKLSGNANIDIENDTSKHLTMLREQQSQERNMLLDISIYDKLVGKAQNTSKFCTKC